jgi:class 3 adenylate cyclase/tetratricopeptide (TPR) repeat protein
MKCPKCGSENREGAKFCGDCRNPLLKPLVCASCGSANPPGRKFCDECGGVLGDVSATPAADPRSYTPKHLAAKILSSRSALEGERKQVTILFADVKGSMDLSESIDPEDWHGIMERFFRILTDGVHRFEGTVNQYTGDGIMALFGAPITHEDHAARACYAALSLQDDLRRYANELRLAKAISFSVRMGLNSGEVVVGKIGDDLRMDYTALGHTASLGARMEQIAEPGKAYLTEHTAKLVEGLLELQDLGKLGVKGVKEPLAVYELQGIGRLRTRLEVSRARGFSKFVGREREMAILEDALDRALQGNGQVVGIVADAGVGKSRLCLEFVERCRGRGLFVNEGHCPAHGKVVPYLPILELFRSYFGITPQDPDEEARRKTAGTLLLLDEAFRETLALVFEFLGVADPAEPVSRVDPEAKQRQLLAFLRRLIDLQSARQPTLVLIDDLHWIDQASDAFVAETAAAIQGKRMLFLLNFRPEYERAWMRGSSYQQLPLLPLGREAAENLLGDLLGRDGSLGGLKRLVHERTGGNPFFIEEIVQSLGESGLLEGKRGSYRLVRPLEAVEIPPTVKVLIAARIDRLHEQHKELLHAASVIGKSFPESILKRVSGCSEPEMLASLAALEQAELVYQEALYPEARYAFKHPLTQEVAYGSQLSERRRSTHSAVAAAIEALYPDKLDEQAATLAHHYEAAGHLLEAARWNRRAAEWAGRTNFAEASRLWQRVRMLVREVPEQPETLALGVAASSASLTLAWRLGFSEQETAAIFAEGRAMAERAGDRRGLAKLLVVHAAAEAVAAVPFEAVAPRCLEGIDLAAQAGDKDLEVGLTAGLVYVHYLGGRYREALKYCERALRDMPSGRRLGPEIIGFSPRIALLHGRGALFTYMGRLDEASSTLRQAVEIAPEEGEVEILSYVHGVFVELAGFRGQHETSLRHGLLSIELAEKSGSYNARATAYGDLGIAYKQNGHWAEAVSFLERSTELARANRNHFMTVRDLAHLAEAYLGHSDSARACATADEAVLIGKRQSTLGWEISAHLARARVVGRTEGLAARSRIESDLDGAARLVAVTGGKSWEPFIHQERAELARLIGDGATRERELREAHRLFLEIGAPIRAEQVARELES